MPRPNSIDFAIEHNDFLLLKKKVCEQSFSPEKSIDYKGNTALTLAVSYCRLPMIRWLIKRHPSLINTPSEGTCNPPLPFEYILSGSFETPLDEAVNIEILQEFMSHPLFDFKPEFLIKATDFETPLSVFIRLWEDFQSRQTSTLLSSSLLNEEELLLFATISCNIPVLSYLIVEEKINWKIHLKNIHSILDNLENPSDFKIYTSTSQRTKNPEVIQAAILEVQQWWKMTLEKNQLKTDLPTSPKTSPKTGSRL